MEECIEKKRLMKSDEKILHDSNKVIDDNGASKIKPEHRRPKRIDLKSGISDFPSLLSANVYNVTVLETDRVDESLIAKCYSSALDAGEVFLVHLRGLWAKTCLNRGTNLRLIDPIVVNPKEVIVDWSNGLALIECDTLVSCTSISQAVFCKRRVIIGERFQSSGEPNKNMLIGNIVHILFQMTLIRKPRFLTKIWLTSLWHREFQAQFIEQMVALNLSIAEVDSELQPYIDTIVKWVSCHMESPSQKNTPLMSGCLGKVADIEENIWDPRLGFKGKIDVSLQVQKKNGLRLVEPLELKTGRSQANIQHAGQILLYCLALSTHSMNRGLIGSGTLLYLKDGVMNQIRPKSADLKGILQMRNELAYFLSNISEKSFPEPLLETRSCMQCPHSSICSLMQRTVEDNQVSSSMLAFSYESISHLNDAHKSYFAKWTRWSFLEWSVCSENKSNVSNIWKIDSNQREKDRRCLSVVVIEDDRDINAGQIRKFVPNSSVYARSVFAVGDMVIVSSSERLAIAIGCIVSIQDPEITISFKDFVDRFVLNTTYLLDKYDSHSIYSINLCNIAKLMDQDEHQSKLRSLIIDLATPTFSKINSTDLIKITQLLRTLSIEQARGVTKSITAMDYVIIQGFPGSGKTKTMVVLIQCLLLLGRSVLLTTYTHSALDNLLSKLLKCVCPGQILRLGRNSPNKDLDSLTLDSKLKEISNAAVRHAKISELTKTTPIVACTCLSISSSLALRNRRFSLSLVDEASLVLESTLLPALCKSDSFVLVGDPLQLSPLVQSRVARCEGMSISLMERLMEKGTDAFVSLRSQYRMNRCIAELSSEIFYRKKLVCADHAIAESKISLHHVENIDLPSLSEDLRSCLSTKVDDAVIFVDTQSLINSCFQMKIGTNPKNIYNDGEIEHVLHLCKRFLEAGVKSKDIGVICVYRYQSELLRQKIPNIEVNTVDQYQGREKSVIILSLVWTEKGSKNGSDLLLDPRRINVAITRSMHKLIFVGCASSMKRFPIMANIISSLRGSQIKVIGT